MFNWLLLLIIYIPFQIALNPQSGVDLASIRVFIVLFFIIWLAVEYKNLKFSRVLNLQALGLLFFFIVGSFSILLTENYLWGIRKLLFFLSVFPLYFLIIYLIGSFSKIRKIIFALSGSAGLVALVGLIQFFNQFIFGLEKVYQFWAINIVPVFSGFNFGGLILAYNSWLVEISGQTIMRSFSLFSDAHMLSFYIGLILPIAITLLHSFFRENKRKFSIIIVILCSILYLAFLLTFTRGAYLAIIVSFITLAWLLWRYLGDKNIPILLLLSLLIFIIPGTPISYRFYSIFDLEDGSNVGRLDMWQEASRLGLDRPWFGIGLGNYSLAVDSNFGYRNPITAHNFYLDIFSEMGIFALVIWLFLIFGTIRELFFVARTMFIANSNLSWLATGMIGSLVYFLVHSFFETSIYNPVVFAVLMIIFGLSSVIIRADIKQ